MEPVKTILVVDDQVAICYSIKRLLENEGFSALTCNDGETALRLVGEHPVDLVIMDVRMPEMDGLEVLRLLKEREPALQVIMMTAYSTTDKAIQAMKLGAYDYLTKPFENDELLLRIREALRTREMMTGVVRLEAGEADLDTDRVVGRSQVMLEICKQVGTVASTDATVLLMGESGTGKELIARAIFHHSRRASKPFLAINCSAIPEQLLESELFGYERGAFSGAEFRRLGKFEQCNGGTLFLDEIADMPLSLQAKLLRVLHDGSIQRLGGHDTVRTDVRIIAATNCDLDDMVRRGAFREDLFYRINVVTIRIPPLRERREDIRELVHYFIAKYNRKIGRNIKGVAGDLLERLEACAWPGNVRELENFIQKSMVFCKGEYLTTECAEEPRLQGRECRVTLSASIDQLVARAFSEGCQEGFQEIVGAVEKSMIRRALELTKGNQVRAAKMLGISRNTLRKKLEESAS